MPRVKSDEEYNMMKNEAETAEEEPETIRFREDPVEEEEPEHHEYQMDRSLFRGVDGGDEYFKGIKRRSKKDSEPINLNNAQKGAGDGVRSGIDVDLELKVVETPQAEEQKVENVEKPAEVDSEPIREQPKQSKNKEKKVLYTDDINNLAEFFKVYSDSTRLKIIHLLSLKEVAVSEIAEALDITQSATSHQLKILRTHRLVKSRKVAKQVFYSLDDQHIIEILNAGILHINEQ